MPLEKVRCPTCRAETPWQGNAFRPFCSARCKMQDLLNWDTERYRVPGPSAEVESDAEMVRSRDDDDEPTRH